MRWINRSAVAAALTFVAPAGAATLEGPARFCGYSPIIDLKAGERIETLQGGIHGGTFRWFGEFGEMEVSGIGWAARPRGTTRRKPTAMGHVIFTQRRIDGRYVVAIWNRAQGAAYFSSPTRLNRSQIAAIERVDLFEEGQEPISCKLRTTFSWDFGD